MHQALRRIRGIVVAGLLWAIPWALAGGLMAAALFPYTPHPPGVPLALLYAVLTGGVVLGAWGAFVGMAFGVALTFAGRRRTLAELSRKRVAVWGAIAAAVGPVMAGIQGYLSGQHFGFALLPAAVVFAAVGALTAAGHLTLAQRGGSGLDRLAASAGNPAIGPRRDR
jgi:hypothetical protein